MIYLPPLVPRQIDLTGNFFPPESLGTTTNLLFSSYSIFLGMSPPQIGYFSLVEHLGWVVPNPGSIQVHTLRSKNIIRQPKALLDEDLVSKL